MMGDNMGQMHYLEFSCQKIELISRYGEMLEGSFIIRATDKYAEGKIYSSDTRMRVEVSEFKGHQLTVQYCFVGVTVEPGKVVRGEFVIISNYGEYTIPYSITIQKPQLESSLGQIKNLFHFTNLAKACWSEAVEMFYSPHFETIFQKSDKNAYLSYIGLSRNAGNEQNVEEFLIEANKKTPVIYMFDIEGFLLEDIQDSTSRTIQIEKNGWGYTNLSIHVEGDFIKVPQTVLVNDDFNENICQFTFFIEATMLHKGLNKGNIVFCDACNQYTVAVDILMEGEEHKQSIKLKKNQILVNITKSYVEMKLKKKTKEYWIEETSKEMDILQEIDEDNTLVKLYKAQMLIAKDRFNEAKWYLNEIKSVVLTRKSDVVNKGYYLYLTTLFNRDENYIKEVCDEIENMYANNAAQWWLAWFLLYLDDKYSRNDEEKWNFIENLFKTGCKSPVILCEAVLLLQKHPTFLLKLDAFEENVLWHAARYKMLKSELVDQMQYLAARKKEYSILLHKILVEIYKSNKSPQTIATICRNLIIGDKKGCDYFKWYALGVEYAVRVTGLYEYYMMSLELDKYGDIKSEELEIPRMVLMYFAYQSSLDYERNAFLYSYIIKNSEKYPDLTQSYKIAIERFVANQIRNSRINENLAYLYQQVLMPQMISDDIAYSFVTLLFMHRIYVDNPNVKNVVVIHEKVNGESTYPVVDNICMIPIYGSEYKLFLQDEKGNRFTKSIKFENKQLMEPEDFSGYISQYMHGRLSFDIYLCEMDKNYITISHENVRRYKNLVESPQVIDSFKKEIRTKLLRFYYDNDMIGDLDAYLEDIEGEQMESQERAEFIKYLISRGMFEKAYIWIKVYGVAGVNAKMLARLISKRIVIKKYEYETFLINISYYIYKNMKYDEVILEYLLMHYEGKVSELKNLWKSAKDLGIDTQDIMRRILEQMQYTGVIVQEKDEILLNYSDTENCDIILVHNVLKDTAYDYFVYQAVIMPEVFKKIYHEYMDRGLNDRGCKLALLKFWAENEEYLKKVPPGLVCDLVHEFLREDIYFPFYPKLSDVVTELYYFRNKVFIEYRTNPGRKVQLHYIYDNTNTLSRINKETDSKDMEYDVIDMKEMYDGIYVNSFLLFHGEVLQYYITESYIVDGKKMDEQISVSEVIYGDAQESLDSAANANLLGSRFLMLNDIMVSRNMQDEAAEDHLTEEYLYQDFCTRELFRIV